MSLAPSFLKFPLGATVITPGAKAALQACALSPLRVLFLHQCGNWGEVCEEDRQANEQALIDGTRLLSVYPIQDDLRIWIITEADRSVTTILLPEEY